MECTNSEVHQVANDLQAVYRVLSEGMYSVACSVVSVIDVMYHLISSPAEETAIDGLFKLSKAWAIVTRT